MSELKAGVIATPHDEGMSFHRGSDVIAVTERETKFYLKSEADREIRYQKYKRCLAMSKWCKAQMVRYINSCDRYDSNYVNKKTGHYHKWLYKWLELAEKFKEGV